MNAHQINIDTLKSEAINLGLANLIIDPLQEEEKLNSRTIYKTITRRRHFYFCNNSKSTQGLVTINHVVDTYKNIDDNGQFKLEHDPRFELVRVLPVTSEEEALKEVIHDWLTNDGSINVECFVGNNEVAQRLAARTTFPIPVSYYISSHTPSRKVNGHFSMRDLSKTPQAIKDTILESVKLLNAIKKGDSVREIAEQLYGYSQKEKSEKAKITKMIKNLLGGK